MAKNSVFLIFFLFGFSFAPPPLLAESKGLTVSLGAINGEQLIFNVHWMGIPAGRAEMKMETSEPDQYQLSANVETIGMVKFLHAIQESLLSQGLRSASSPFQSVMFEKKERKGKRDRLVVYHFDRQRGEVARSKNKGKPFVIKTSSPQVSDPLALFYALRAHPKLTSGTTYKWLTVDGRKEYAVEIEVGQSQKKFTPLGGFDILPIKIKVPASGDMFRQEEAIEIWLTTDDRRLPIRVETRLSLGGVAADLVEFSDGRGEHRTIPEERM